MAGSGLHTSWAFQQLNQLTPSPGPSPVNGSADDLLRNSSSLSFPVSGSALQAQLEAWTNVTFDFDGSNDFGNADEKDAKEGKGDRSDSVGMEARRYGQHPTTALDYSFALDPSVGSVVDFPGLLNAPSYSADPFSGAFHPSSLSSTALVDPVLATTPLTLASSDSSAASTGTSSITATSLSPESSTKSSSAKGTPSAKKRRQSTSLVGVPFENDETPASTLAMGDDDAANALAIEEDKRRRNTAASARFRIKKKQREAALESTAKELRDRVASLERDVDSLRTENGWLRGLIVDKAQKEEAEKRSIAQAAELARSTATPSANTSIADEERLAITA